MLPKLSKFTLVDLLAFRAATTSHRLAFHFVAGNEGEESSLTYGELHERARAVAGELQRFAGPGERALLLYPPGLDFVAGFFGCLYAGIAAVPAAPPGRNRTTSSVEAIVGACQPSLVLSTGAHRKIAEQSYAHMSRLFELPWIATERVPQDRGDSWQDPQVSGQHAAFLQYTSGSTSSPKGVVLSHDNLLHNAALTQEAFGNTPEGSGVSWLPLHHDMGLIGGVVQPIHCGAPCTLMAPAAFLQRPALWLETISRTGATVSGGPDFAYDLCARKVSEEDLEGLDLSTWEVAFTGAERIRAETIERFSAKFAPCGFRREAFFPCYGLAEATLMVSGGPRQTAPTIVRVRGESLGRHQVQEATAEESNTRTLVGCGQCLRGQKIVIVAPDTCLQRPEGEVGEIWVRGPSVGGGYYEMPEVSKTTFGGRLADSQDDPFLRTGDLGFLREGQLFVTGRLKDVIIIRGRNHYPEDIERSVERAHEAFRAGYCAAFSVDVEDRERLVVVQEIEPRQRNLETENALGAIRRVIAAEHDLEVDAIVLAKAGAIPKTSSGKTRRSACREKYLREELETRAHWKTNGHSDGHENGNGTAARCPAHVNAQDIEHWLIERIMARLRLPQGQVRVSTPFLELGMGSVDAVEITADLERWLGRRLSPTAIYNYPNIGALAEWLSGQPHRTEAAVEPRSVHTVVQQQAPEQLLDAVRRMSEEEMQSFILEEMAKQ